MSFTTGVSIEAGGALAGIRDATDITSLRLADGGAVIACTTPAGTVLRFLGADGQSEGRVTVDGTDAALCQTQDGNLIIVTRMSAETYRVTQIDGTNTVTESVVPDFAFAFSSLAVTATTGNGFVVATTDTGGDAGGNVAIDTFDGTTYGSTFFIDESAASAADVQVTTLANGNLAYAWVRQGRDGPEVMTAITTVSGTIVSEPKRQSFFAFPDGQPSIQETVTQSPSIIATDRGFALAVAAPLDSGGGNILLKFFNENGKTIETLRLTDRNFFGSGQDTSPVLAAGPDGSIAVSWTTTDEGGEVTQNAALVVGPDSFATLGTVTGTPVGDLGTVVYLGNGGLAGFHIDAVTGDAIGQQFTVTTDSFDDDTGNAFAGDGFANIINGQGGRDRIEGRGGNDDLIGGDGMDIIFGGRGDDLISGEDAGAQARGKHHDELYGDDGSDTIVGEDGNDTLFGGNGIDSMDGGIGKDILDGGEGEDTLLGGDGKDTLSGNEGLDTVTGGAGADQFLIYDALPDWRDEITDFVSGTDEIALFLDSGFIVIGTTVDASELRLGDAAQDGDDFLIYNAANGRLYFDRDGDGAEAQFVIANIGVGNTLVGTDFVLV